MGMRHVHLDAVSIAEAVDEAVAVKTANHVAPLTNSTGGTASTTLAAGITDAVAKNAVASLATQLNAVIAALVAAGLMKAS